MLAPGRGDHFLAAVIRIKVHVVAMRDGIAQLGGTSHGRIFCEIPLNRGNGGVFDVLRGREVRLARAKIDHVDSLRAQLVRLGHYGHGGGGFNAVDSFRESQRFRRCRGHAFLFLFLGTSTSRVSRSLYAGASFSRSFCSTTSGTSPFTGPPACATSLTSRELT